MARKNFAGVGYLAPWPFLHLAWPLVYARRPAAIARLHAAYT